MMFVLKGEKMAHTSFNVYTIVFLHLLQLKAD